MQGGTIHPPDKSGGILYPSTPRYKKVRGNWNNYFFFPLFLPGFLPSFLHAHSAVFSLLPVVFLIIDTHDFLAIVYPFPLTLHAFLAVVFVCPFAICFRTQRAFLSPLPFAIFFTSLIIYFQHILYNVLAGLLQI